MTATTINSTASPALPLVSPPTVAPPKKRSRRKPKAKPATVDLATVRPWFGVADLIFILFAVGTLLRSRGSMLDDPGLGWHLRNIDAMLAAGGWLTTDPFTTPLADWPWRTNVWLGDLWLWLGWHWGGLEGIAVATSLVLALICRVMYSMLVRDGVPWPAAACWTFLGGLGTSISWVARPNVFSLLFMMIVAWQCDRYHRGKCSAKSLLWLPLIMAVWVNAHGGFLAGLVVIGTALGVEIALALGIPYDRDCAGAKRRAKSLALALAGSLAATLANPYGWTIYPWIARLLGNPYFMNNNLEWHSPDFHAAGAMRFELFILLLPVLIALSRRRPSLVALAISLVWLHGALTGQRYIALWVVVTVPLAARLSLHIPWLNAQLAKCKLRPDMLELLTKPPQRASWLATALAAVVLVGWARAEHSFSYISQDRIPTAALDDLIPRAAGKVVFHHYNWGGYLTWRGWPEVKNWIDDRNEVHGQAHIEEYFSIMEGRPGWREKLDEHQVTLVCIPPEKPLADRLSESPAWHEVYRDEHAVTFERAAR